MLFCFLVLFYRIIIISKQSNDEFGMFLAWGININIIFYVLINISYVVGILPTTGLPLPFFSYGGSHTLFTLSSIGILLNISTKNNNYNYREQY